MGLGLILPVRVPVTIGTVLNSDGDGHGVGTYRHTLGANVIFYSRNFNKNYPDTFADGLLTWASSTWRLCSAAIHEWDWYLLRFGSRFTTCRLLLFFINWYVMYSM